MMWIVRLALRSPYTFVVAALMIMLLGVVTIGRMPTDIFPGSVLKVEMGTLTPSVQRHSG